jgi:hypothetical protein
MIRALYRTRFKKPGGSSSYIDLAVQRYVCEECGEDATDMAEGDFDGTWRQLPASCPECDGSMTWTEEKPKRRVNWVLLVLAAACVALWVWVIRLFLQYGESWEF